MRNRTYGFVIVGLGVIAPLHAGAIASLPNAELRAVVDVVPELVERRSAEWGVPGFTDLAEALARPDIDVVCVTTPSGLHAQVGIQAAEAGKHVVVEKPIDVTLGAADRLIATCRRGGVRLTVIFQHRWDPGIQQLRQALDEGRFGRLVLGDAIVKWYRSNQYYASGGWRATWELDGGGALMNQGVHYVDLLRWLMGPVDKVFARWATAAHEIPVEDVALALLTFKNGALGVIEASTAVYPGLKERIEISGTEGTAIVEAGELTVWALKAEQGEVGPYGNKAVAAKAAAPPTTAAADPAALQLAGHRAQLADFLEAIETGREPLITGEEGRKALELNLAIYESARTGREVTLPLPGVAWREPPSPPRLGSGGERAG